MRVYETTFIVNPQADDSSIDRQVNAVVDLITENGGKIIRTNKMGTRRMAYPIHNLTQGYYADFIFEAPQSVLPKMERLFKLEEPYIRHLIICYDGDPRFLDPDYEKEESSRFPFGDRKRDGKPPFRSRSDDAPRTAKKEPEDTVKTSEAPAATPDAPAETPEASVETPEASVETPDASVETPDAPAETPDASAEPPVSAEASVESPAEPPKETTADTEEEEL